MLLCAGQYSLFMTFHLDRYLSRPPKIRAASDFPTPTNQIHLRSFLGMCCYYTKFAEGYAAIAAPLSNKLKKSETKLEWDDDCENAFNCLKQALTTSSVLIFRKWTVSLLSQLTGVTRLSATP